MYIGRRGRSDSEKRDLADITGFGVARDLAAPLRFPPPPAGRQMSGSGAGDGDLAAAALVVLGSEGEDLEGGSGAGGGEAEGTGPGGGAGGEEGVDEDLVHGIEVGADIAAQLELVDGGIRGSSPGEDGLPGGGMIRAFVNGVIALGFTRRASLRSRSMGSSRMSMRMLILFLRQPKMCRPSVSGVHSGV